MIESMEHNMLRDTVRDWVRDTAPVANLRAMRVEHAEKGYDPAQFRDIAAMGWAAVSVSEAYGGFDLGLLGAGIVAEEMGRNLVASPLLTSSVVVASAVALLGDEDQKMAYLPALASGELVAALAIDEGHRHDPAAIACEARLDGDQWVLSGTKDAVFDGGGAQIFAVVARVSGQAGEQTGLSLFLCPAQAEGLTITRLRQIDSRSAVKLDFDQVRLPTSALLGSTGSAWADLSRILDRGCAVLAAEMLGSASAAFDATVEYLKTRIQFGQPIGSFQALQHRAAYLFGQIELTRSAVWAALLALDGNDVAAPQLCSLAKALAGKTFRKVAQEMVQMHGGIGMTDEHDAGLYLKRAHAADMIWGNEAYHRQRYARLVGL